MYLDHNPMDDITEDFEPSKFDIVFMELYGAPLDVLETSCDREVIASCIETVNEVLHGVKHLVYQEYDDVDTFDVIGPEFDTREEVKADLVVCRAVDWPKPF